MQFSKTIIFVNVLFDGGEYEINEKDEFDDSDHSGAQSVEPKEEKEKPEGGGRKKTKPKGVWHSVSMDVWHPLTRPMPSGGVHFDFLLGKSCFGLQLTKKVFLLSRAFCDSWLQELAAESCVSVWCNARNWFVCLI